MARPAPESEAPAHYDVVVIGGGINGAGIARDAAERGLSVLLVEKYDFGSGTSSWSSRLIHGGLRYLEYGEFPLVFESLRERRILQKIAPHLVRRLPLTVPVYDSGRRGMFLIRLGMIAYDLLSIGKVVPRHRMLSREKLMASTPGLNSDGLKGGARYFDAQLTFAERLVVENVVAAAEAGAVVRNYSPVIGITVAQNMTRSVQYIDGMSGQEVEATAAVVVNAAGPWVDRVLSSVNREMPTFMGGTKGSHIVVPQFSGAPKDAIYAETVADGRPFFIIPWNDQVLIGTTDIRYQGDPGELSASDEEVRYLLDETNRLFPQAGLELGDIHFAYAGVRPLPKHEEGPESAITRKHIIKKHHALARGLISIIGGKLTTYRNLAEQTVDYVNRKSGSKGTACSTRTKPLPGAVGIDEARKALARSGVMSHKGQQRLLQIYGGRTEYLLAIADESPELNRCVNGSDDVFAAEVVHAIRNEYAVTLIDIIHRRMMIGLSADQGRSLAESIADIAATEAGWSRSERNQQLQTLNDYQSRFTVQT